MQPAHASSQQQEEDDGQPPPEAPEPPTEEETAANADVEMKEATTEEEAPAASAGEVKERDEEEDGDDTRAEEEEEQTGRGRKRGRRAGSGASRELQVMVKRELLAACMTCHLCNRLLRDATTVSECLHTFCRKCIYKKFNDEEVESCPKCNIDLGCTPVEKLRADHSLQDVRSKIFPFKRKKIKADDAASPISPPNNKIKERSISSLVVHTPRLTPTGSTGRRTKVVTRKAAAALRGLGPTTDNLVKKENDVSDKNAHISSLPANSGKVQKKRRQILSNGEASNHSSNKDTEDDSKDMADNAELWRPLNCLVEAANRTKSIRSSLQSSAVKREQLNGSPSTSTYGDKTKPKEHMKKPKMEDDKKDAPVTPVRLNKKLQGTGRRKRGLRAPADVNPDGALTQNEKRFSSIWFSLVASFEQKGDSPLPQIPSHYLRIKDANIPASSIQKYLVQKLSLPSESEVEINCCGQPVDPTQPLHNLVELWLKGRSTQATQATVGSPAEDFVMVLTYGRTKAMAP